MEAACWSLRIPVAKELAVVGFHGCEPGLEAAVAGPPGHHLGEAGDMPGEGVGVRALTADGGQLG